MRLFHYPDLKGPLDKLQYLNLISTVFETVETRPQNAGTNRTISLFAQTPVLLSTCLLADYPLRLIIRH